MQKNITHFADYDILFSQSPFTVTKEQNGQRLDTFLKEVCPHMGVRGVRRLWEWCHICVNSKKSKSGALLVAGDIVTIEAQRDIAINPPIVSESNATETTECGGAKETLGEGKRDENEQGHSKKEDVFLPYIIKQQENWFALHKQHGLHSAHLAGGRSTSLELLMEKNWPFWLHNYRLRQACENVDNKPYAEPSFVEEKQPVPRLVTRLDAATAGIVLATYGEEEQFKRAEQKGEIHKTYFALVHGQVTDSFTIKNKLHMANRKVTLVAEDIDTDVTRHTLCEPLIEFDKKRLFTAFTAMAKSLVCVPAPMEYNSAAPNVHKKELNDREINFAKNDLVDERECINIEKECRDRGNKERNERCTREINGSNETTLLFPITLVRVTIQRGARHQIRAHLAFAGFSLVGEWVYAQPQQTVFEKQLLQEYTETLQKDAKTLLSNGQLSNEHLNNGHLSNGQLQGFFATIPLFLHHAKVEGPFITAVDMPLWVKNLGVYG